MRVAEKVVCSCLTVLALAALSAAQSWEWTEGGIVISGNTDACEGDQAAAGTSAQSYKLYVRCELVKKLSCSETPDSGLSCSDSDNLSQDTDPSTPEDSATAYGYKFRFTTDKITYVCKAAGPNNVLTCDTWIEGSTDKANTTPYVMDPVYDRSCALGGGCECPRRETSDTACK